MSAHISYESVSPPVVASPPAVEDASAAANSVVIHLAAATSTAAPALEAVTEAEEDGPASSAPSANTSLAAPAASSSTAAAAALSLMASVRTQVTSACHITPPVDGSDGNVFVHVIDGLGVFSCAPADLTYMVLHAAPRARDYSVVGIMGCQSTGKSTLLNLLFGTKFQEMDSTQGRSQTTKGVWMDSGAYRRDLVIMDLEGTDSGERGEDRTTFERQTSLYALAVAEVLLINMWEHDIGRYTASNYGILKTVFEVNLALFDAAANNQTVLLFVIRDHIEEDTPLAQLIVKLSAEVEKIWSEIRKPERLAKTPVGDLFHLRFVALPHMKLQRALFTSQVDELRAQFTQPAHPAYLLTAGGGHGKKRVPADGFGVYMQQCWEAIQANKELNLPTQKEMLATFRCDEIIAALVSGPFAEGLAPLKKAALERLVADEFAQQVNPLLRSILGEYATATQHYHSGIVLAKKAEFVRKMLREIEELFAAQARKHVAQAMQDVLKRELKAQLAVQEKGAPVVASAPHPHFMRAVEAARAAASEYAGPQLAKFQLDLLDVSGAVDGNEGLAGLDEASRASLVHQWVCLVRKIEEELAAMVETVVAGERATQLKKLPFHLDKQLKAQLSVPLNALLKKAAPTSMWPEVGKLYRIVHHAVVQEYVLEQLLPNYSAGEEERTAIASQCESQLGQLVRLIVEQHSGMIGVYMRSRFDKLFRSDSRGRVRTWTANEHIRALFRHARDEALKQLDLFAIFRLDEYKQEDSEANQAALAAEEEVRAKAKPDQLNRRPSMKRLSSVERQEAPTTPDSQAEAAEDEDEEEEKIGQTTIDYSAVDPANVLLDPTQRLEKESTFRFEIESALREAEIAAAQNASNTKVPMWMIGLVCFLGMDEILAVLRNPLLLLFLVLAGGGAYMAHQVGALWPMITVAKSTAIHIIGQIQAGFTPVPVAAPASTNSSTSSTGGSSSSRASRPSISAPSSRPSTRGSVTASSSLAPTPSAHARLPSLSSSYTDGANFASPKHSRPGSAASGDMLPVPLRGERQLEMQDLTPHPRDQEDEDQDSVAATELTKRAARATVAQP